MLASEAGTAPVDKPAVGARDGGSVWDLAAGEGGLVDDLRPSPAQIPDLLLNDPVFAHAARARDFTTVFSMAREHGVSFYRIGEAAGMKAERVAKVARGNATVTTLDATERIADALRIPGAFVGLAARPWEHSSPRPHPEADDGDDPMNRRQILRTPGLLRRPYDASR